MSAVTAICLLLRRAWLELQIQLLAERCRMLRHGIALDQAAAAYHQEHFSSSPVLQRRMQDERAELDRLASKLNDKLATLARLELLA